MKISITKIHTSNVMMPNHNDCFCFFLSASLYAIKERISSYCNMNKVLIDSIGYYKGTIFGQIMELDREHFRFIIYFTTSDLFVLNQLSDNARSSRYRKINTSLHIKITSIHPILSVKMYVPVESHII